MKQPTGGASCLPRRFPRLRFPIVLVSIYVYFEFIMKVLVINDDDDDDERKTWKKAKFVSYDRSGHDDQFCPKIVKIGAILRGETSVQSFTYALPCGTKSEA